MLRHSRSPIALAREIYWEYPFALSMIALMSHGYFLQNATMTLSSAVPIMAPVLIIVSISITLVNFPGRPQIIKSRRRHLWKETGNMGKEIINCSNP